MSWSRSTKWRQGCMIQTKDCNLFQNCSINEIALAISHDCDIANDNLDAEPFVEFVIGKIVECVDGNRVFAKNPRILIIDMIFNNKPSLLELIAHKKHIIPKELLADFIPDKNYMIKDMHILQSWLSARYRRQTLPDNLVSRIEPIFDFLEKNGKKYTSGTITFFFDYEPKNSMLNQNEPYELWIYVIYLANDNIAARDAQKIASTLTEQFHNLINKTRSCIQVFLQKCEAYSEQEFTLFDIRRHVEYSLEHLSNRITPPGPIAR